MDHRELMRELGHVLGFDVQLSEDGTCGVFFDEDEILFEVNGDRLFLMADLASSIGREDAYQRLLKASNLGLETGFSCIGIDEVRSQFTLCRVLEGDLAYSDFEKILTMFVGAVRYWKKWLRLAPESAPSMTIPQPFSERHIRA